MTDPGQGLRAIYTDYIACLNARNYDGVSRFVNKDAVHNGRQQGVTGYTQMIKESYESYPWLHFNIVMLVVDEKEESVASRLVLKGEGSAVWDGPRENVFYQFRDGKISEVWSMLEGFES